MPTNQAYEEPSRQPETVIVIDEEEPVMKRPLETSGETLFSTSPAKRHIGNADRAEVSLGPDLGQVPTQKRHIMLLMLQVSLI